MVRELSRSSLSKKLEKKLKKKKKRAVLREGEKKKKKKVYLKVCVTNANRIHRQFEHLCLINKYFTFYRFKFLKNINFQKKFTCVPMQTKHNPISHFILKGFKGW